MDNLVKKILEALKDHVEQNNHEIQLNQEDINQMIANPSNKNKDELDYKKLLNKELFNENEDFITMQIQLTEFMKKFGHLFSENELDDDFSEDLEEDEIPYFNKTISGQMSYNPSHPQFSNSNFFRKLLEYYEGIEDYEKCDELIKIHSQRNFS